MPFFTCSIRCRCLACRACNGKKTIMQTPQSMFYNGTEKFTVSSFTSLMEIFLSML